jgi:hypothetical protein
MGYPVQLKLDTAWYTVQYSTTHKLIVGSIDTGSGGGLLRERQWNFGSNNSEANSAITGRLSTHDRQSFIELVDGF